MSRLSVRARLTLTSVALIALSLLLFGVAVRAAVGRVLLASIENALWNQADGIARRIAAPRADFGPNGPQPPFPGDLGGGRPFDRPEPRFPEPPGGPRFPSPGGGPPPRRAFLPARELDLSGHVLNPLPDRGAGALSAEGFRQARQGEASYRRTLENGESILVYSRPAWRGGRIVRVIQTAASLADTEAALRGITWALVLLLPVVLALAGAVGAAVTARALNPVRRITEAAAQIEANRLGERLPVEGDDEFGRLSTMLNAMLARLESAFERQRRFTADASHELRTPLAVIKTTAEMARENDEVLTPAERQEALSAIDQAADRAARLVRDLLLLARGERGALPVQWERVAAAPLLAEAVETVRIARGGAPGAAVRFEATPADLELCADRHLLLRALTNLLENALRHTPAGGEVSVTARRDGARVRIAVADTGEGVSAEHLARLGEPFYRVDAARSRASGGAGLGLSLCRAIAEALGGTLRIESAVSRGTTVTLSLPAVQPLSRATTSASVSGPPTFPGKTT